MGLGQRKEWITIVGRAHFGTNEHFPQVPSHGGIPCRAQPKVDDFDLELALDKELESAQAHVQEATFRSSAFSSASFG